MPEKAYKVFSPGDIVEHVFFDSEYRVVKSGTYYTDVVTTDGTKTDISFPTVDLFVQAIKRTS